MLHSGLRLSLVLAALACLPAVAYADDAMSRVERTPMYELSLSIGPAEAMMPSSPMMHDQADTPAMGHDMDTGMTMHQDPMADQGMAVNHHLDVRITRADTGAVVGDLMPIIRVTDKATGESRDLPQVLGMASDMSGMDWHYGQNVFLPDGTYHVAVLVGPSDTAMFRDVMVVASEPMMMADH
jgi:hypothetical protein